MLFGMFFGAGNLIFPVQLGQGAGTHFWFVLLGFLITAITLPFIGILSIGLSNSKNLLDLGNRVHPTFSFIFSLLLYLAIGPLCALPRTATVPFVVGFEPFISENYLALALLIFSFIFFALTCYFSLNPAKVMDYIGKYLTPAFLVFLFILIGVSIVSPMGKFEQSTVEASTAFMNGFTGGYQTMDALAALAFGAVIVHAIKQQGFTTPKQVAYMTWKSGLFAMILMMIIYGFIMYIGATSLDAIGTQENGGLILTAVAQYYFGKYGALLLAIIIVLACLKTSIGLTTACSEFFHDIMPRIRYRTFVVINCIVSFAIANVGLSQIIRFAEPVLFFLYPIAIVLTLLTLLSPLFQQRKIVFIIPLLLTLCISVIDGYNLLIIKIPNFTFQPFSIISEWYDEFLPFYTIGLGWLIPALIGFIFAFIWHRLSNKNTSTSLN